MIQYNEKDIQKLQLCLDTLVNQLNRLAPIEEKLKLYINSIIERFLLLESPLIC